MKFETYRFQMGSFSCVAIQDYAPPYPIGMFLTNLAKEQYEPWLRQRGEDPQQIELPYTCLLIDTGRDRVLVDTGIGVDSSNANQGKLLPLLQAEGIEPHEIGTVVLSHGHSDHIGGTLNVSGQPAFPNARYVMFRKEWDYWMSNPSLVELPVDETFKKAMLASAQKNLPGIQTQLDLVDPDTEIVPGIMAIAAFGHSPGQMGLEIWSTDQKLLFLADAVVLPLHLEYPETIGVTDHLPGEMVATRIRLLEKAAKKKSLVATSHFSFPGLGYVVPKGDRWEWRALHRKGEVRGQMPSGAA
jgi:glyoxylase-like metal-dependent hydrolase (beta-lactamase superfamily II)